MKPPVDNTYWVQPNRFLAGEYPWDLNPEKGKEKLDGILAAGCNLFVDLTEERELNPYTDWLDGAEHVRMPIRDVSIPTVDLMVDILDLLDASFAKGKMPYVHCWGGIGRTGTVVGCWLARHGDGGGEGLNQLKQLWTNCTKSAIRNSPETAEQESFILNWRQGQ